MSYPRVSMMSEAHARVEFMNLTRKAGFFESPFTVRSGRQERRKHRAGEGHYCGQNDSLRVPALLAMKQPNERG